MRYDRTIPSYEDICDALAAVVRGQAIPEAYAVIEQVGYHELFYGVIYREEIWMEITVAREIIKRAKKDDIYDGPLPEDDPTAIAEAQNLVEMAEQAWAKHIRGPEVEAILKIAAGDTNGSEPEAESEAEATEDATDEHSPPETDDSGTEGEQRVLQNSPNAERLAKMEPWEGYGEATVKDVTEGINYFAEDDASSILEVLEHVWSFETAHKNRARILTFISEMYEQYGGKVERDESEGNSEGQEAPEPVDQTGEEEAVGGDSGAGDQSAEEPEADSSDDGNADAEPESEIGEASGEGSVDEAESGGTDSEGGSDGSGNAYQKLVKGVEAELKRERIDVPKPPDEKAPELPWSWHEIADGDLQDLHMRYAVCAYYKQYRVGFHERVAQHCKEAADALHAERMVSVSKYDEKGKEKKVGLIEAEIALDPHVKRWRQIQRRHEQLAAADRREMDGYYKVVESLSRLETMRHNAWERARR